MRGLRRIRPWVQGGLLVLFLALLVASRMGHRSGAGLFFWFDPLVGLVNSIAGRTFHTTWLWAIFTLFLTLLLGRVWCGWICPLGSVLDAMPGPAERKASRDPSPRLRRLKYLILFFILSAAILGNLTLIFLDPITLLYRTITLALWPAVVWGINGLEAILYKIPFLQGIISSFDGLVRGRIIPSEMPIYPGAVLIAVVFAVVLALNRVRKRFWCRYLCPLGALLGLISRWAWIRRIVGEDCKACHLCARSCPMGTIDPDRGHQSDPAECIVCLDCIPPCPTAAQTFGHAKAKPRSRWEYDPKRRHVLGSIGLAVAGTGVLSLEPVVRGRSLPLRPPGVNDQEEFLSKCIRCGLCMRVCPTGALQPSIGESGWVGFWTPVFVPRLGYCDYSCNACGQVCPAGAIPALNLEEKRKAVIGYAYIDRSRCIPWVSFRNCIVCEEMCPVPDKAIQTEEVEVWAPDGQKVKVRRPHVIPERCIGCGTCEYHCPLSGEAAIRVKPATDLSTFF